MGQGRGGDWRGLGRPIRMGREESAGIMPRPPLSLILRTSVAGVTYSTSFAPSQRSHTSM